MDGTSCSSKGGNSSPPSAEWIQVVPGRASRTGGLLWKSFFVGRPVMKQPGLAFGRSFIEKKIGLAGRRVAIHLPRPQFVVAGTDPQCQSIKVRGCELLGGLFDFLHRVHDGKIL